MDAETIDFCGKSYVVVKRLYKSWGSQRQTMTETPDHRTDCHKSYHIVSLGEEKFWLKTWIVPDAPHLIGTAKDEYDRLILVRDVVRKQNGFAVRAIRAIGFEGHGILTEYCPFPRLSSVLGLIRSQSEELRAAAMGWLGASGIGHYDLCDNNVLIDIPSREVRLVDFEMSTGNSCAGFLRYA